MFLGAGRGDSMELFQDMHAVEEPTAGPRISWPPPRTVQSILGEDESERCAIAKATGRNRVCLRRTPNASIDLPSFLSIQPNLQVVVQTPAPTPLRSTLALSEH